MRAVAYLDQAHLDGLTAPELYQLDKERELVAIVAAHRGFELGTVYESAAGDTRDDALAPVRGGEADALIVPRIGSMCSSRSDLVELLAQSTREGWGLLVLDLGLDTSAPLGRAQAVATQGQAARGDELPNLPPPELRLRVTGMEDPDHFAFSGWVHVDMYERLLRSHGLSLDQFQSILDFGGGPGRIVRNLRMRTPAALALCDIDEPAVTWVADHLPEVDARVSRGLPPLPFADDSFDLVLCFSVFTHLDEEYQNAWLAELHRVTRQGGAVIATVHGECSWQAHAHWAQLAPLEAEFRRRGFLYRSDDGWGDYFPDFYHTAFHQSFYVRARWSRWFDVVGIVPGRQGGEHDFVILRQRWTPRRVRARARARAGALKRRVRARAGVVRRAVRPARHAVTPPG